MKNEQQISAHDWDKFKRNEKNFGVLSEIIDQLQDINMQLNGWTDKPYTFSDGIPVYLHHTDEITDKEQMLTFDVLYVLEQCEQALCKKYDLIRAHNLKIAGIK